MSQSRNKYSTYLTLCFILLACQVWSQQTILVGRYRLVSENEAKYEKFVGISDYQEAEFLREGSQKNSFLRNLDTQRMHQRIREEVINTRFCQLVDEEQIPRTRAEHIDEVTQTNGALCFSVDVTICDEFDPYKGFAITLEGNLRLKLFGGHHFLETSCFVRDNAFTTKDWQGRIDAIDVLAKSLVLSLAAKALREVFQQEKEIDLDAYIGAPRYDEFQKGTSEEIRRIYKMLGIPMEKVSSPKENLYELMFGLQ